MLSLRCPAQNYDWGRVGMDSEVAQLVAAGGGTVDGRKPYAELWMGTHPSGPATVVGAPGGMTLKQWIEAHPSCLGDKVLRRFGPELPYLFKVLSVAKALSIQSHPDKALGQRLHASDPKNYKDANHKPEMALALSPFEALCGFATSAELCQRLQQLPELAACVGQAHVDALASSAREGGSEEAQRSALQAAFTALMTADPALVRSSIAALVARLRKAEAEAAAQTLGPLEALLLRLDQQYPGGDVGVLSSCFLNHLVLPTGACIYLPANQPHAYLAGEIVEAMAASDNVIRAGLTPKFKDVAVLCSSLTYSQGKPEVLAGDSLGPSSSGSNGIVKLYRPPFEEFEIQTVALPAGGTARLEANQGPLMVLVQQGSGTMACADDGPGGVAAALAGQGAPGLQLQAQVSRGAVLFVAAGVPLQLAAGAASQLLLYVAAVNGTFFQLHDALQDAAAAVAPATANGARLLPQQAVVGA